MTLKLYMFETCPYCQRVLKTIQKAGRTDVELHDIHKNEADRQRLIEVGGKEQVPCLFIDGKPMYESLDGREAAMEKKELTCIGCPVGCSITVKMEGEEIVSVEGNSCRIGDRYARSEVTNPVRTLTSTALITGGVIPRVSVRTTRAVPKGKIADCMREIDRLRLQAPVSIGETVLKDIAGTGVDVIATKNVDRSFFIG